MAKTLFEIQNVENGYILRTETLAADGGSSIEGAKTFVFTKPQEITAWFTLNFPANESTVKLYLLSVPRDKKIATIKIVRENTGLGLKDSKDLVDATDFRATLVRKDDGSDFTPAEAHKFASDLEKYAGTKTEIKA